MAEINSAKAQIIECDRKIRCINFSELMQPEVRNSECRVRHKRETETKNNKFAWRLQIKFFADQGGYAL